MSEKLTFKRPSCRRSEIEAMKIAADRAACIPGSTIPIDAGVAQRLTAAAELAHRHSDQLTSLIPALASANESLETQGRRLARYEERLHGYQVKLGDAERLAAAVIASGRARAFSLMPPIVPTMISLTRDILRGFVVEDEDAEKTRLARASDLRDQLGDDETE